MLILLPLLAVGSYFMFFTEKTADLVSNDGGKVAEESNDPRDTMLDELDNNQQETDVEGSISDIPDAVKVTLVTDRGKIELELYPTVAPKTACYTKQLGKPIQ